MFGRHTGSTGPTHWLQTSHGPYLPPSAVRDLRTLDDWRHDVAEGFHEIEAQRECGALESPEDVRRRWGAGPQSLPTDTETVRRIAARWLPRLDDRSVVEAAAAVAEWYRTCTTAALPAQEELLAIVDRAMTANMALVREILRSGVDYPVRDLEEEIAARQAELTAILRGGARDDWPEGLDPDAAFTGESVQWKDVIDRLAPGKRAKTIEQRCRNHERSGKRTVWAFLHRVKKGLGRIPQEALDAAAAHVGQKVKTRGA